MRLYEFEGKFLAKQYGIPVPTGENCLTSEQAISAAERIGYPVVLKSQVLSGGRGKAGGIRVVRDNDTLQRGFINLMNLRINNLETTSILIEKYLDIQEEIYIGITIDELKKRNILILSKIGGVGVEEVAIKEMRGFLKYHIDPFYGIPLYKARELASGINFNSSLLLKLSDLIRKLYMMYIEYDATLVEVNPLVITRDANLFSADLRMEIDDDAIYRQKDRLNKFAIPIREEKGKSASQLEIEARKIDSIDHRGVAGRVVEFDGDIGLIIGGGGASLTVFDAILRYGGKPANYCEIGGNPTVRKLQLLTELLMKKPGIKCLAVITNVLSNTRVDLVARGVIKGLLNSGIDLKRFPVVFRVPGSWEEDGFKILDKYGIKYFDRYHTMDEAAKYVVAISHKL